MISSLIKLINFIKISNKMINVKFKELLIKNNKYLRVFVVLLIALIFFLYESTENKLYNKLDNYIEKFENKTELHEKFDEFVKGGYEKDIDLSSDLIEAVIDTAKSYKNVPNKIGGTDRKSIDASGLVYVSINANTKFTNKSAQDMSRYGQIIFDKEKLKRGDLLFFYDTYESKNLISSVGIYLGKNDKNEDEFIISSSSKGVTIADLNDQYYWKDKFFFGTRIFN